MVKARPRRKRSSLENLVVLFSSMILLTRRESVRSSVMSILRVHMLLVGRHSSSGHTSRR